MTYCEQCTELSQQIEKLESKQIVHVEPGDGIDRGAGGISYSAFGLVSTALNQLQEQLRNHRATHAKI